MFKNKEEFKELFQKKMESILSKQTEDVTTKDAYQVLVSLVKEQINKNWVKTNKKYKEGTKQVYYFSIEFLIGKLLMSNLINMDILDICREGLKELGFDLEELEGEEPEAGLGNGGLGRLAAAFLDSLASLQLPGHGCGIRYKYGLFKQKIVDGNQVELPDNWLSDGYLWEVRRSDKAVEVHFGGEIEIVDKDGQMDFIHKDYEKVKAVPYDIPIVGYDNRTVNTLRLWNVEVTQDIPEKYKDINDDRYKFIDYKRDVESIAEFLYPDDSDYDGKILRLKQQYFLCSAGLKSILRSFEKGENSYQTLPDKISLHVNDTHPALLIPELMRILMDEKGFGWDEAWDIIGSTISYTNHTILSEALEKWPVKMFKDLLPRIYMIVEEINERFCSKLWKFFPGDFDKISEMAIIANDQIRMANLCIAGCYSVNGVSSLHTKILKQKQMSLFYEAFPQKFNNKTNGITHRRWLIKANPQLTELITEAAGPSWKTNPKEIFKINKYQNDASFKEKVRRIKLDNKKKLAQYIKDNTGIRVDPQSIFDTQAKRLHEYKRQLMNILHIIYLYKTVKENPGMDIYPRTFIFAAKAASSYYFAKKIIKLINDTAAVINNDKSIDDKIKVVFLENYSVSMAEKIIPATDVSEQISTAGKEASGTGNMKFMMNGALTLGTMDGANVNIHDMVGKENIFIFGLSADEVMELYKNGQYSAENTYYNNTRIKNVLDSLIEPGFLFENIDESYNMIFDTLINSNDRYFVLKDFDSYTETQEMIDMGYRDQDSWLQKAVINIAHSGKLSSDRTISEYAANIWDIKPEKI